MFNGLVKVVAVCFLNIVDIILLFVKMLMCFFMVTFGYYFDEHFIFLNGSFPQ